jgi:hypothetical protein
MNVSVKTILNTVIGLRNKYNQLLNYEGNYILLSINNKMQRYTVFFITINAVHVSGGSFSRNMYSIDNNKEYCIMLHLVGYT